MEWSCRATAPPASYAGKGRQRQGARYVFETQHRNRRSWHRYFDNTFNVNVRGTLFTVQKALPLMRDGGSVIMTGSIASAKGFPGLSVYNASKAAIRSFARTWTVDLKDRHIRVNVISPGTIDTGIFVGVPKEVKDQFVSIIPMGRIGQPHEIAAAALFLASDDSSFVTGIELFVDGGTAQI